MSPIHCLPSSRHMSPIHHRPSSHHMSPVHYLPSSHHMSRIHYLPSSHHMSPIHHLPPSHHMSPLHITCHRSITCHPVITCHQFITCHPLITCRRRFPNPPTINPPLPLSSHCHPTASPVLPWPHSTCACKIPQGFVGFFCMHFKNHAFYPRNAAFSMSSNNASPLIDSSPVKKCLSGNPMKRGVFCTQFKNYAFYRRNTAFFKSNFKKWPHKT